MGARQATQRSNASQVYEIQPCKSNFMWTATHSRAGRRYRAVGTKANYRAWPRLKGAALFGTPVMFMWESLDFFSREVINLDFTCKLAICKGWNLI